MTNAEKFQEIFKKFATEVWAFPEKDFLTWLNAEYKEPTTKNDLGVDCISRQAVIDGIKEYFHDEYYQRTSIQDCRDCFIEDVLNNLPSVTPQEPRKGHWKLVQRGKVIDVCCSNCEAVRIKEWAYNYTIDELNKEDINECFGSAEMRFCPNCGADMREVE